MDNEEQTREWFENNGFYLTRKNLCVQDFKNTMIIYYNAQFGTGSIHCIKRFIFQDDVYGIYRDHTRVDGIAEAMGVFKNEILETCDSSIDEIIQSNDREWENITVQIPSYDGKKIYSYEKKRISLSNGTGIEIGKETDTVASFVKDDLQMLVIISPDDNLRTIAEKASTLFEQIKKDVADNFSFD